MESDPRAAGGDQLRRLVDELEENTEEAGELAGGLTAAQLRWRPGPDAWSVAECLDHLVRTGESYLPRIDRALERARDEDLRADGPFSRGFLGRWLVRGMEPPPGLRIPSPADFLPEIGRSVSAETPARDGAPPDSGAADGDGPVAVGARDRTPAAGGEAADLSAPLLERFGEHQRRLVRRIRDAHGLDLEAVSVPFPVAPFLPINLFAGFAYLAAHQRRHLWQARRVTGREGFPAE